MMENHEKAGAIILNRKEFEILRRSKVDSPLIQKICENKGIKISDLKDSYIEVVVDGKIKKISNFRGDFGTEVFLKGRKFFSSDHPFSSEDFPVGSVKCFFDRQLGEERCGKVVSLCGGQEGKKVVLKTEKSNEGVNIEDIIQDRV